MREHGIQRTRISGACPGWTNSDWTSASPPRTSPPSNTPPSNTGASGTERPSAIARRALVGFLATALLATVLVIGGNREAFAAEQTLDLGALGNGIAVLDNAQDIGYLMWSAEPVQDRFAGNPPLIRAAEHLVAVQFAGGQWTYNPNGAWDAFSPRPTDVLLYELDFSADTARPLVGVSTSIEGIAAGYVTSDLEVAPNRWNGNPNTGEFALSGSFAIVDDDPDPVDPDPVDPDPVDPPAPGQLNAQLPGDINVALNRPASQAPGVVGDQGPQLAVDGNRDGDAGAGSVMRTFSGREPYLQIDLESEVAISEVRVFGRTDCCRRSSDDYFVFIADEGGIPGTRVGDARNAPNVQEWFERSDAQGGQTTVVNTTGRYVRIQIDENDNAVQLAEVEVVLADGATYIVDPGDQQTGADQPVDLSLAYQVTNGSLEVIGLPGGLSADAAGRITGTPRNTGRWFVEARLTGDDGLTHIAKFEWSVAGGAPGGVVAEHPPVDPRTVGNRPLEGVDGVGGRNREDSTPSLDIRVWDMQQAGDHMYVGGEFQQVFRAQDDPDVDGDGIDQPFLARFHLDSGKWDETWRPVLDGNVHALELAPRGILLVGGEFTNIDGADKTQGLAAIDPATGQVDPSFEAFVERPFFPEGRAIVRELEVVGTQLYVVGNFSHINGAGGSRTRVYKAARVSANYGTADPVWAPEVVGGSVWGIGIDQDRGRVHMVGYFDSIGAVAGTGINATVDTVTGALVEGLAPVAKNEPSRPDMFDVEYSGPLVWYAGSQHVLSLHDAETRALVSWNYAGNRCEQDFCLRKTGTGGDFQFVEKVGDFVFAGCHCGEALSDDGRVPNHYSKPLNLRSDHVTSMAYHADTGALVDQVRFDLGANIDGGWSVATDDRGCVWLGGDVVNGGFVEPGGRVWARGFARFCNPDSPPDAQPAPVDPPQDPVDPPQDPVDPPQDPVDPPQDPVDPPQDPVDPPQDPVDPPQDPVDPPQDPVDPPQDPVDPPQDPVDPAGIALPINLAAEVSEAPAVRLSWEPGDNAALLSYLVYRDGDYQGWASRDTAEFVDTLVEAGRVYEYQVRAVGADGTRSDRTAVFSVGVGVEAGPDVSPPSVPGNLAAAMTPEGLVLSWDASVDDRGTQSYLLYRNSVYVDWADGAATSWLDPTVAVGESHEYQVRAVDRAGNRSERSEALIVTIG